MSVFRLDPLMPADQYKTYGVSMPLVTHWRPASCEEVDCEPYTHGWVSTFDLSTDLGQQQYHYCAHDGSRRHTEQRVGTTLVKLIYGPGQQCFRFGDHKLPLDRPARYTVRDGDWRGNPRGTPLRVHQRAEDWIEDFSEHQDRLATAIKEG